MAGSQESRIASDKRRRQLLYRSAHRGIKEMDILLGGYVAAKIETMGDAELEQLERLMEEPDNDMLDWFTGKAQPPVHVDSALIGAIAAFHAGKDNR